MTEAEFDSWAAIIRSVCLTSKTPLTMHEISRDVRTLEGSEIPYYKTFNFRTLEEMVRSIPNLRVYNLGGQTVAQAIPTEATAHIGRMVRVQKTAKKKKKRTMAPKAANRMNMGNQRPTYPRSNYNRSNSFQNYVPNNRPTGQYSSPQQSFNNRSQQPNGEQFRRTNTSPATMQTAASTRQQQAPSPTTPKVQFPPTPPPTPQQPKSTTTTPTTTSSFSSATTPVQQRIAQAKLDRTPPAQPQARMSQPTQQQRPSPTTTQTPQARLSQASFASPPTTASQQSSLQQRLATPGLMQSSPSNIQERLNNVQISRSAVYPMNDPRLILNSYVEARQLPPPVYKDVPSKDKNIYSSVTVDSKKYSSYPKEAKTKDDAEKLAAQAALTELLDKSNMPQTVTSNRALIMQRILDIINAHPNGLFESSLVASYRAKYNEGLPPNWLKLVEHAIHIDVGANNLTILSPQQDTTVSQSRTTSPTLNEPPVLDLSNLSEFFIRVYVVYNPTDVWGVIIGEANSDQINDMAIDMKHFYSINEATPTSIIPGQYYAVLDSEWHRVRCIKVHEEAQIATVFFIDRGDEDEFPYANIRDLSVKYCKLPAQAIQISLDGLESFADCPEMQELLEEALVDKDVWVTVDTAQRQVGASLPAQCYIQEAEDFIKDVNAELIREFMSEVVHPKNFMKTNKAVCEVYISEIRNKEIFVQVKSTGLKLLNDILTDLASNYLDVKPVKPAAKLEQSKLYLVKAEGKWKRIKVLRELTDKAEVMCVDEGSVINVEKDCLVAIEGSIPNTLAMFPPQASQVNLHKISPIMFDKKMAAHLRSLAPKEDVFYMKVVGDREPIPRVELYKRTENNYLASLNDTLALEPEISSKPDGNNNQDKSKSRLRNDRKSVTARTEYPLKTPEIPSIDSYFDVIITMAAHPSNFTVQPLKTTNELTQLMLDLSAVCMSYNGPPLTASNVKVGNMYAAKYDNDGRWYRAYVSKVLGKDICVVYFCDYGDYRAVSLEHLQPLANQFYDLPYQAIKAKLHGIVPKLKGDWTVKDSLRFNELVVDKPFVSIVKAYDVDNTAAGETILSLELIDTSTADDIYIIQQLIDEKRAERIDSII